MGKNKVVHGVGGGPIVRNRIVHGGSQGQAGPAETALGLQTGEAAEAAQFDQLVAQYTALAAQVAAAPTGAQLLTLGNQISLLDVQLDLLSTTVGGVANASDAQDATHAAQLSALAAQDAAHAAQIAALTAQDVAHAAQIAALTAQPQLAKGPWIKAPAAPDAWDLDASTWTNPDIAANGWVIQLQGTPHTALTRVGEVDVYAGLATTQYRSSLIGGLLLVQAAGGVLYQIGKPTSNAAFSYKARVISSSMAGSVTMKYLFLANIQNSIVGSANFINGFLGPNFVDVASNEFAGGFTVHMHAAPTTGYAFLGDCIFYTDYLDPTTRGYQITMPNGPSIVEKLNLTATRTMVAAYGGLWLRNDANQFHVIDFIRRTPYRAFP